jgi:uncharacterized membrane protein
MHFSMLSRVSPWLLVLLLWASPLFVQRARLFAQAGSLESDARVVTAAVFEFFEAKCAECHGAHLAKPKKFGYILDLERLVKNEEFFKKGSPDESEFYRLAKEDEMPGDDSGIPAATFAEKALLKRWIEIGMPVELPDGFVKGAVKSLKKGSSTEGVPTESSVDQGKEEASVGMLARVLKWLGSFHMASTHFPIALLMAAALAELLAITSKREVWLTVTRFLLVTGALAAVQTAAFGWFYHYSGVSKVYDFHKWLGTPVAIWGMLSAGAAVLFECREGTPERKRLRGAVFVGAALVGFVGFLGGILSYGLELHRF